MEGVRYLPPNDRENGMQIMCTECGYMFESRPNAEGADLVCDSCYESKFEPVRVSPWRRVLAHMRSTPRAR